MNRVNHNSGATNKRTSTYFPESYWRILNGKMSSWMLSIYWMPSAVSDLFIYTFIYLNSMRLFKHLLEITGVL